MSEIKVNKISPRSGTEVTLGDSGDTFTIPAGATITNNGTQTGFGRTGAVDWQTTPKTATFTAVSGEGYFINSGSSITANLPAGSAGAIVAFSDYARNFATYNFIVSPNGSEKIGGIAATATLAVNGQAATFVYVDSTKGWVNVQNAEDTETGEVAAYVAATGGNTTATAPCGDYKIHTFTGPGTFCVSNAGNASGSNELEYIVVAGGGGGGGQYIGGGGGAGGFRFAAPSLAPLTYPAKPLAAPAGITATVQGYPIVVGGGGTGNASASDTDSTRGSSTTALGLTATGGGAGKQDQGPGNDTGQPGGSGGGGAGGNPGTAPQAYLRGLGNTPSVSPAQGEPGGSGNQTSSSPTGGNFSPGNPYAAGGGGGALARGADGIKPGGLGGAGGVGGGFPTLFGTSGQPSGSFYYFAGGGGGNASPCGGPPSPTPGTGGLGGGGAGVSNANGTAGTVNTGGGGGGTDSRPGPNAGGGGGSGIVIIRYKFQN
jgi:hypothetical protein